jgi:hypothetical protein
MRIRRLPFLGTPIVLSVLFAGLLSAPPPSQAMPNFAQAYGVKCSVCHTMVPLLNANGRYVQRTGYASLDRATLTRALPFWLGENVNMDSSLGSGTGTARYTTGNIAFHADGSLTPEMTFHVQQ